MTEATSYAVSWSDRDARFVGHARLGVRTLTLEGRGADGHEGLRTVGYEAISGVDVRRASGRRGIELQLTGIDSVTIWSLDRPGSLAELADRLRRYTDSPQR